MHAPAEILGRKSNYFVTGAQNFGIKKFCALGKSIALVGTRNAGGKTYFVFFSELQNALRRRQVETHSHSAKKIFRTRLYKVINHPVEKIIIQVQTFKVSVTAESAYLNHSGFFLSLPCPRGYFKGVDFTFLTAISVRFPHSGSSYSITFSISPPRTNKERSAALISSAASPL